MRLTDVLELGVRRGLERRARKRAGVVLPLAVGAMIPGIVDRAVERAHSTERALESASHPKTAALPMQFALPLAQMFANPGAAAGAAARGVGAAGRAVGGSKPAGAAAEGFMKGIGNVAGAPAQGVAHGLSSLVERKLFGRQLGERQDALGIGGAAAAKSFGSEVGKAGLGLLQDIANKAMEAAGHAGDQAAREAIVGDLKKTDSVLANADDGTLMEAYHTMTRFAPVLSTDKNAVRSFLRQAVTSGAGPDFMSIKLIADAERAVTGGDHKRAAAMPSALAELLPSIGRGALLGAGTGAISGAMADKDDRGGGALRGALSGGALGGLGGALHKHLTGQPKAPQNQGYARGVVPQGQGVPWSKLDYLRDVPEYPPGKIDTSRVWQEKIPDSPQGAYERNVPKGVEQFAHDLQRFDLHDLGASADRAARERNSAFWR